MLFNPSSKKGISAKLIHKWRGPFVIVTQTSPVNYLIKKADNGKKTDHVHVSRLKSCYIRDETYNGLKFLSKMKTSDDAVHASKIKNKDESKNSMTTSKEEFEIERIVDKQLDEISQEWWYRVRWKGFSDKEDTWEAKEDLINAKEMVDEYESKIVRQINLTALLQ